MVLLFVILFLSPATAQTIDTGNKPSIFVWPVHGEEVEKYIKLVSTRLFENEIIDTEIFRLIDKQEQQNIASKHGINLSDYSFQQILSYAKETDISYALDVRVEYSLNNYKFFAALYDFQTGRIIKEEEYTAFNFNHFDVVIEQAVTELILPIAPQWYIAKLAEETAEEKDFTLDNSTNEMKTKIPLKQSLWGISQFCASTAIGSGIFLLLNRSGNLNRDWLRKETNYNQAVTDINIDYSDDGAGEKTELDINNWIGYGLLGTGFALSLTDTYVLSSGLSTTGKAVYTVGTVFEGIGYMAAHTGMVMYIRGERAYDSYIAATSIEASDLYNEYMQYTDISNIMQITGLVSSITAGITKAVSPVFKGEKKQYTKPVTNKILLTAGDICIASAGILGNYSYMMLEESELAYLEYSKADASTVNAASKKLQENEDLYNSMSIAAYSTLGVGVILKIAGVWFPDIFSNNKKSENIEISETSAEIDFSVMPLAGGIALSLRM